MTDARDIVILDPSIKNFAGHDAWRGIAWQYADELNHHTPALEPGPTTRYAEMLTAELPARYRAYTFDNLQAHAGNQAAIDTARNLNGVDNLYLWGQAGNGKTHLAVALAQDRARSQRVSFWNTASLFSTLRRAAVGEADWPDLARPAVLVIDDIGKVKPTDFVYQELYRILEERWSDEKQTIFTANHRPTEAAQRLTADGESGRAVLSRMAAGVVVEVRGKDQRLGSVR